MQFKYKAQNKEKKIVEGVLEAPDRFALARKLREDGLLPLETKEFKEHGKINLAFIDNILGRIKLSQKIVFTRNLSGMLSAGLSLYRALEVLGKQTKNKKFKEVIVSLLKDINAGGTLSSAMEKFPKVFSPLFVSMVAAGEESGSLPSSLKEVGIILEKSYNLNKKIKGALMYPGIILSAILLIGVLMLIFVVPTLTKTFMDIGATLPASTQFVVSVSDFLQHHTLLFFGIVGALIVGFRFLLRLPRFSRFISLVILKLPVIGNIAKEVESARTSRTLASLLSSGVAVTKALAITKNVLQNPYYKAVIDEAIASVEKGVPMSTVFKAHTNLYPVMVGEMVEVGEETGNVVSMFSDIATFYETEVDQKTKDLSTIIEPVLMIFIGAAVGFFAISMLTPMYSLLNSIK